jgi:hypothetical protein
VLVVVRGEGLLLIGECLDLSGQSSGSVVASATR